MSPDELSISVAEIIAAVRTRGDEALLDYTRRWDGVELIPETLRVDPRIISEADIESDFAQAFRRAAERIRSFHAELKPRSTFVEDEGGNRMGMRWRPIQSAGLYIPGGKASYPSTLAMTAIPAQIAGVGRIVVVSPPGPDGEVSSQVLLAARVLGIEEIYRVGGAQAVAALALGTGTLPRVDKIFGPGNAFVAEAKKQLYGEVGIDMLAGPSEVVVYADHTTRPEWVAADLMAQAEHDEATCCTLLASSEDVLAAVRRAIASQIEVAARRDVIRKSFEANGTFAVVASPEEAAARIDEIAPEHLSIQVEDPWGFMARVRNAGAIFLGPHSPVALGDYYAGPHHCLPTGGTARFASCLSVEDFMKRSNVCQSNESFLREQGGDVEILAEGERLPAHAASVALRRSPGPRGARRGFDAVESYHLVEEEGGIKLNQNESPWDIPIEIKDEVFTRLRDLPWNRYHQKVPDEFRRALAERVGVDPDLLFLGNGSNLVLQWVFEAFGGPGRRALIPTPSFSLFRMWGRLSETTLEEFDLKERDGALEYPREAIVERIRDGRRRLDLTVLNRPNNPTGSDMSREDFSAIVEATEAAGGWVVVDEAYHEFSDMDDDRADFVRQGRRVLILRTFSKALSAAGLRIGYLLAPEPAAEAMRKIVPPFHVNLFNAVAGIVLCQHGDLFDERVRTLSRERERVMAEIAKRDDFRVFRSRANFFLVRVPDASGLKKELAERGILVRRLGGHPLLDDCVRINLGTPEENDRLLAELDDMRG